MFIGRSPEEAELAGEETSGEVGYALPQYPTEVFAPFQPYKFLDVTNLGGNDDLVVARDRHGRPQLFRQGDTEMEHAGLDLGEAMPFRDYPGVPAPRDRLRDNAIIQRLRERGNGLLPKKSQILDYPQSKALFEAANNYFQQDHPLMNTERWLAGFVERNDITYTDHDGRRYKMKNGMRYPVSAARKIEIADVEDVEEPVADFDDGLLLV